MSRAARSVFYYSFYLFAMGTGMVVVPNLLLGLFGFAPTTEIWIRVLGLFTITVGLYYLYSARNEQVAFFQATVAGRLCFFIGAVLLVVVYGASPMLILIASVDLLGALITGAILYRGG